ncbi:beta-glucosidase, putative [Ricinus communis]|uniref:Beta-glucosidase, putative n=1 Tax=Ricinus communis TaxID=3988 RepID=B9T6P7_RICCO|nr:beta-glucosidase, putative [Ricinus communis]
MTYMKGWYPPTHCSPPFENCSLAKARWFNRSNCKYNDRDYPLEMRHFHGSALPKFSPEEISIVKGSIDFIATNHDTTLYAKDCIHSACVLGWDRAIRGFVHTTGERDGVLISEPMGNPRFFLVLREMEKIVNCVKERYNNIANFCDNIVPYIIFSSLIFMLCG